MSLRAYLNSLPSAEQIAFAARCGTTIGYLRKWLSSSHGLSPRIAIAIERESGGVVRCEGLVPNVDWAFIRNSMDVST